MPLLFSLPRPYATSATAKDAMCFPGTITCPSWRLSSSMLLASGPYSSLAVRIRLQSRSVHTSRPYRTRWSVSTTRTCWLTILLAASSLPAAAPDEAVELPRPDSFAGMATAASPSGTGPRRGTNPVRRASVSNSCGFSLCRGNLGGEGGHREIKKRKPPKTSSRTK